MNIHIQSRSLRLIALVLSTLFPALLLQSCTQPKSDEPELVRVDASPHVNAVHQAKQDWSWITNTEWILSSIESQAPIGDLITLRFETSRWLNGSSGCNRFTGSYNRQGIDGLQLSKIASTRMLCQEPQGIMQQESRFLHLLSSIDSYHAEPDTLTFYTNNISTLTFTRQPATDSQDN